MPQQLDMFASIAPAPVPAPPAPVEAPRLPPVDDVHWLHVTTKRAITACGISVPAFYCKLGSGYAADGAKISATANGDDGTVTCPRCREEMQ